MPISVNRLMLDHKNLGAIAFITGSIPEKYEDKIYNTCTVFGPDGNQLALYRKVSR